MTSTAPALTRRDHLVLVLLGVVLALIVGAIAWPGLAPAAPAPSPGTLGAVGRVLPSASAPWSASPDAPASPASSGSSASPAASGSPPSPPAETADRALRIGLLGPAVSINPLTPTGPADDDLAALVFSGLVRLGPGQSIVPDLASHWTIVDEGRTWLFTIREDARWHDGRPVTAADVVFTVRVLRDPGYTGPAAASWRDVTASAVSDRTVRFELSTPIGGFLQAATQPILPAHLLGNVPVAGLATTDFNRRPVGSGPYRLVSLSETGARLVPAVDATSDGPEDLDVRFYADAGALARAWDAVGLDLAGDLPPDAARGLAADEDTRLLRYPGSTVTAVLLNLRPSRPELRDAGARAALLQAIDRPAIVAEAWDGRAVVADSLIPRASWAFDPAVNAGVPFDRAAAAEALEGAGWTPSDGGWTAPGANEPYALELLSPDLATNPGAYVVGAGVAADLSDLGLAVTHAPLGSAELVKRLRAGSFAAAIVDINVGLDPDLYPLLAASQTLSTGLNLSGLVDRELDKLLEAARAPGTDDARRAAYRALQQHLAARDYLLPIAFRDEVLVARDTVDGPATRQVASAGDRYWDVLTWRLADYR